MSAENVIMQSPLRPGTSGCALAAPRDPLLHDEALPLCRIVPQIQGPYYRNFYGGYRVLGCRHPHGWHDWNKKRWYEGYHFYLDVF